MAKMTVKKRRDDLTPRVFMHKTNDIRGGVSVAASELGGDYLREGAILSAPVDGITHVVKTAEVVAEVAAADTTIKVSKFHNFKVGDIVMTEPGKAACAITAIDESNKKYDTLTVKTALGAIVLGGFLVEAKAEATGTDASKAELKYEPQSVNGTGQPFDPKSNISTDAWVHGVTRNNPVPSFIIDKLKGIINL